MPDAEGVGDAAGHGSPGALARVRERLVDRLLDAGLGPGGARTVLVLGVLAAIRAIALVGLAESIAAGVVGVATGADVRTVAAWGAVCAIVRGLGAWASGVVAERAAIAAKSSWRASLADRLLRPAPASGAGAGEVATLASTGLDALDEYFTRVVPAAVQAAVVPVVLGVRILAGDWVSAVVVALTLPLVPFFMVLIGAHTRQRVDEATGALTRLADHLVELARGLPVLVGLARAEEQAAALDGIQRDLRRRTQATLRQAFLSALALELIATISVAIVAVFLGVRLVGGDMSLQVAIAVLVLAPECYAALREVGTAFHQAQDGTSALRRVRAVLDAPDGSIVVRGAAADSPASDASRLPSGRPSRPEASEAMDDPSAAGEWVGDPSGTRPALVVVDGLTVQRPGRSAAAVRDASLEVRRGEIVAITGPSGAGKSTVLTAVADAIGPDAVVSGEVRAPRADALAAAPQEPAPFAPNARAEFVLAAGCDGAGDDERALAASAMLAALALEDAADRPTAELTPASCAASPSAARSSASTRAPTRSSSTSRRRTSTGRTPTACGARSSTAATAPPSSS